MDLGLGGKVALVAGASRGLGHAIARELAGEGTAVAICARGEERLAQAGRAIAAATGARVLPVAADVSKPADVKRLVRTVTESLGRVDVLVTNSGGPPPGTFESTPPEAWQGAFDVLLASAVGLIRAVLPGMKERRFGRILNVTSITVKQPVENLMLSNTLRAAVTGFARTLANEVATSGVTVNNILPGFTRTERVTELAEVNAAREGITVAEAMARFERQIPMARLAEPREFAAMASFLVSERASYVTGQSVAVDGGWIRGLF